ncbi:MAG TPA: hypothetical protein VN083_11665 [Vicinamibacteria bacterium]|nr:hypothetical protein [Vicinamibacteria bacterium]
MKGDPVTLRALALISGVYDLLLGVPMLFFAPQMAALFGAPAPVPRVNAELNGLFTVTLAIGYFWAAQNPAARRGFFWAAGVFAKGLGAALFVLDHFRGGSPDAFLLFAATDGSLAALTLFLLLSS